jgi:Tripartite tricarboxylate transporter TctB family
VVASLNYRSRRRVRRPEGRRLRPFERWRVDDVFTWSPCWGWMRRVRALFHPHIRVESDMETGIHPPSARTMVKADFVTGLIFMALGLAVVIECLRMPRFEELQVNPYTVPGLVPGILGAIILILGAVLFLRAARAGGWRLAERAPDAKPFLANPGTRRLLLSVALCLLYAGGLIGRLPFWPATFLFVAAFVILFEWPLAADRSDRARRVLWAVLLGAAISAATSFVFQEIFLVRLP